VWGGERVQRQGVQRRYHRPVSKGRQTTEGPQASTTQPLGINSKSKGTDKTKKRQTARTWRKRTFLRTRENNRCDVYLTIYQRGLIELARGGGGGAGTFKYKPRGCRRKNSPHHTPHTPKVKKYGAAMESPLGRQWGRRRGGSWVVVPGWDGIGRKG